MVIFSWEASLLKLESLTPIFKSMLILRFRIPFNIIKMNISGKADIESPKIFSQRTLSLFGSSCFIFFHSKFALSQFISGYYFLFIDSKINLVFV